MNVWLFVLSIPSRSKNPIIIFSVRYNCKVILNIYTKSILPSTQFYMKVLTNSEDS